MGEGVRLDENRIQLVLTDDLAQLVAHRRSGDHLECAAAAVLGPMARLAIFGRTGQRAQLFDRTEPDTIGLAQSAIDGAGFGNTQFGTAHHLADVRRIGVAKAREPSRSPSGIHGCREYPAIGAGGAEFDQGVHLDAGAVTAGGEREQTGVGDVPATLDPGQVTTRDRELVLLDQRSQILESRAGQVRPAATRGTANAPRGIAYQVRGLWFHDLHVGPCSTLMY